MHCAFDVNFSNTTTGAVTKYIWDFGDGDTSHEMNPAHTYTNNGFLYCYAYGNKFKRLPESF